MTTVALPSTTPTLDDLGSSTARRFGPRDNAMIVVACVAILAALGTVAVFSVSVTPGLLKQPVRPWFFYGARHVIAIVLAGGFGWVLSRIDHRVMLERSFGVLVLVWIGLVLVLTHGVEVKGAQRWLPVGPGIRLQISEFAKLATILCCARYVEVRAAHLSTYRRGFLPAMIWLGITFGLIASQPDFGTSMFLFGTGMLLLTVGGVRFLHVLPTALGLLVPFFLVMINLYPYIMQRITRMKEGHFQVEAALTALGAGGLFGRGLGEGRSHLGFLPEVRNDFIFAAIGEQMGLIGTSAVLVLFLVVFWNGMRIAWRAPSRAAFLVAFGITFMIVFQAAINVAVVTGLVPPKGIGLPFVSSGGSSLLMFGAAVGVLWSVARASEENDVAVTTSDVLTASDVSMTSAASDSDVVAERDIPYDSLFDADDEEVFDTEFDIEFETNSIAPSQETGR